VKCLHAHYAWHLAGGDDPVGRWVEQQLKTSPKFEIESENRHKRSASPTSERFGGGDG
jgi:hypothetical protein